MTGTRWTGDGEGATGAQIWKAYRRHHPTAWDLASADADRLAGKLMETGNTLICTNLALTGEPLQAEDIARILSPQFRVGGGR